MEQKLSDFEKRDERESYGGGDGRAINRHSVRAMPSMPMTADEMRAQVRLVSHMSNFDPGEMDEIRAPEDTK